MTRLSKNVRHAVTIDINGRKITGDAEPRMLLSDFLIHEGITSTHVGCEHGVCGACTVRIDGVVARACLTLAVQADGKRIDTAEGLVDANGELSDLQKAFRKHHALQCGYCTPGMLIAAQALLESDADPDKAAIRDAISGNLCRCTGYVQIVEAVQLAARRLREGAAESVAESVA